MIFAPETEGWIPYPVLNLNLTASIKICYFLFFTVYFEKHVSLLQIHKQANFIPTLHAPTIFLQFLIFVNMPILAPQSIRIFDIIRCARMIIRKLLGNANIKVARRMTFDNPFEIYQIRALFIRPTIHQLCWSSSANWLKSYRPTISRRRNIRAKSPLKTLLFEWIWLLIN